MKRRLCARGSFACSALAAVLAPTLLLAAQPSNDPATPAPDAPMQEVAQFLVHLGPVAPFGRPLMMRSRVESSSVEGQVEGLVDRPLRDVAASLADAHRWCAVLVLHINNKGCAVEGAGADTQISLKVARKYDQPVEQAYALRFHYRALKMASDEISFQLLAAEGPQGTSDYALQLDAVPAGPSRTAVRLGYAYRQSSMTGLAMDLYFATIGRGKVGFTKVDSSAAADGDHVGGARGLIERNLMRYFLTIEAAAGTPDVTDSRAYEQRLRSWFAGTERYPRQLHELDFETYMAFKQSLEAVGVPRVGPVSEGRR